MDKKPTITVMAKRPDSGWYKTNLSNNLQNFQRFVGGPIEIVTLAADFVVVCNEEGKLRGLPYNCAIAGYDFVGDIFVCSSEGDELVDFDLPLKLFLQVIGTAPKEV